MLLAASAAISGTLRQPPPVVIPPAPPPPIVVPPPAPPPVVSAALTNLVFNPSYADVSISDAPVQVVATVMASYQSSVKAITIYVNDGGFNSVYGVQLNPPAVCVRCAPNPFGAWTGTMVIPQTANTEYGITQYAPISVKIVERNGAESFYDTHALQELGYIYELPIVRYQVSID